MDGVVAAQPMPLGQVHGPVGDGGGDCHDAIATPPRQAATSSGPVKRTLYSVWPRAGSMRAVTQALPASRA
jgi:hypothetical protein